MPPLWLILHNCSSFKIYLITLIWIITLIWWRSCFHYRHEVNTSKIFLTINTFYLVKICSIFLLFHTVATFFEFDYRLLSHGKSLLNFVYPFAQLYSYTVSIFHCYIDFFLEFSFFSEFAIFSFFFFCERFWESYTEGSNIIFWKIPFYLFIKIYRSCSYLDILISINTSESSVLTTNFCKLFEIKI